MGQSDRKHSQYRNKAKYFRIMYRILTGKYGPLDPQINAFDPEGTIERMPKYIPCGRSADWYKEQAEKYERLLQEQRELDQTLRDMTWKTEYERMTRQDRLAKLHAHATRRAMIQGMLNEWQAKVIPYELRMARNAIAYEGLPPIERMVREHVDAMGDPTAIIEILQERLQELAEEQQWMVDHL